MAATVNEFIGVLRSAKDLLRTVGEDHWLSWLGKVLARAEADDGSCLDLLLSGYGGMGSFNDLYLCGLNGHRIDKREERRINARFDSLRSELYRLAKELVRSRDRSA